MSDEVDIEEFVISSGVAGRETWANKPVEEPVIEDWFVPSDIPLSDQAFCIDFSPTQDTIIGGAINGSIALCVLFILKKCLQILVSYL